MMHETKQMMASRMADLIVAHVRAKGDCTVDDLLQAGFTSAEIERCKPLALGIAGSELNTDINLN